MEGDKYRWYWEEWDQIMILEVWSWVGPKFRLQKLGETSRWEWITFVIWLMCYYYYCCFDVMLLETNYRSHRMDFLCFRREGFWVGRWSISQGIVNSAGIPKDGYAMKVYMLQELSFVHPTVLSITCLSRPLLLIHRMPAFEMLSVLLHECACLQASLLPYSSNIARHPTSGSARSLWISPTWIFVPIKEDKRDSGCSDRECLQRVYTATFNLDIAFIIWHAHLAELASARVVYGGMVSCSSLYRGRWLRLWGSRLPALKFPKRLSEILKEHIY